MIVDRIKIRLEGEEVQPTDALLAEMTQTATDRVCLRMGVDTMPAAFESIAVDVVVKMFRRQSFEGISSEGVSGTINTSFVDNVLKEYDAEFERFLDSKKNGRRVVRFL